MHPRLDRLRAIRYRPQALIVLAVVPAALIIGLGARFGGSQGTPRYEQEARATAVQFFRALDTRHFGRACDLFSEGFYRLNVIKSKQLCTLSLRYSFSPAGVRYRITNVNATEDGAKVGVVADGAPGELVFVRDRGRFRILSLGPRPS